MTTRLRVVAALAALSLLAAACGDDDTDTSASTSESASESESASASESESASASEMAESASEMAESESASASEMSESDSASASEMADADCTGDYTFASYSGELTVPRNPQKIAVFDMGMLSSLHALGVPLGEDDGVAVLGAVPDDVQAIVDGMTSLGSVFEPDLEALNAMEPDLIVLASRSSSFFPDFVDAGIAPVVDLTSFDDWLPAPGEEAPVDFIDEFE
ncbi:MAG: hypothetical protein AAGE98_00555, partial [Actinomycetota bacterium]